MLKLSKVFEVSILDLTMKDLQDEVDQIEAQLKYENINSPDPEQIAHYTEKAEMLGDYLEGLHKCFSYKKAKLQPGDMPDNVNFVFDFFEQAYDAALNLLEEHKQLISYLRCEDK